MLLKITLKILLYGNNIVLLILFTGIMLYRYPDYTVDVVTVTIIELSKWSK